MDAGRRVGFQEFARLPIGDFMRENRALPTACFRFRSRLSQIEAALAAPGKRLHMEVRDAA
jgi:hypothetical protein